MSWPTVKDLAKVTDPLWLRLQGLVRRLVATATAFPRWQVAGVRGVDGTETDRVEVFSGVGYQARPAAGRTAEVVVLNVDGRAGAAVAVATRDEAGAAAARAAATGGLAAGDTIVHGDDLLVHLDASSGTVEVRTHGGAAVSLATKADIEALRTWLIAHIHPDPASGFTGAATTTPPTPAGTSVLKGE